MCWCFRVLYLNFGEVFVTALLLMQCVYNAAAIKCFVCDSSDNPGCEDLKSNSSIVPEECTLDKMKSLDTWLFELNKFSYFDTGANKSPLMTCQKVVAYDRQAGKVVTARFCQLDTGDSDACSILRTKMSLASGDMYTHNNPGRRGKQATATNGDKAEEEKNIFECNICKTDRCNAAPPRLQTNGMVSSMVYTSVVVLLLTKIQQRTMAVCW